MSARQRLKYDPLIKVIDDGLLSPEVRLWSG